MDHHIAQMERRRHERQPCPARMGVGRLSPVMPLADAEVLNVSAGGVAIRTRVPVHPGERLSFRPAHLAAPILAEVLACEELPDGCYRIRCQCLLGGFESVLSTE